MNRLLIDLPNVLGVMSHRGDDPEAFEAENGDTVRTWEHSYSQFLTAYREALKITETTPRQTLVVLDAQGSRRRRQRIHPEYKAHRTPKSHEYYGEMDTLKKQVIQFLKELGATIVFGKGYEADDTIVHIGQRISDCVVWSTDKDLSIPEVVVYSNGEMSTINPYLEGMGRRFIPLYRTLVGDSSDFGPGTSCKGFGKKAFLKLYQNSTDEDLDNLCTFIERGETEFCGIQKIADSKEMVELTWKLANWFPISYYRLKWDVSYAHDISCVTFDEEFLEFYQEISLVTSDIFTKDLKKLISDFAKEAPYISLDIETSVPEESDKWLSNIADNFTTPPIQVDVYSSTLTGLSITVGDNLQYTYYFPVDHKDTDNISSEDLKDFILSLENDFVAHNASGFELPVLKLNWDKWLPNCHCTNIASSYVDENRFSHALKTLSKDLLGYNQTSYEEVTQGRKMSELTGQETLQYGCDDTITAGFLMNHFLTIMQLEGSLDAYVEVEQSAMYLTASAFVAGANTDISVLEDLRKPDQAAYDENYQILTDYLVKTGHKSAKIPKLSEFSAKEIKEAYKIYTGEVFKCQMRLIPKVLEKLPEGEFKSNILKSKLYGLRWFNYWLRITWKPYSTFKVSSPKEVPDLIYNHMECAVVFRKFVTKAQRKKGQKEGNPKGDADAVKWAIKYDCTPEQVAALKALTRCRAFLTRDGLYYSAYKWLTHWKDGKIRSNLKQSSTSSRRFAPKGPNVNQIPKRDEEGKKVRRCIIPHHKDAVLISPDFSGQELRHSADATKDENFLACYIGENLKDLHTLTAFEICQQQGNEFESYDQMMEALADPSHPLYKLAKDYRGNKAKATNFLSQYISLGGGVGTLSEKLQISEEVAQKFLKAKAAAFPGVDVWKADYTEECRIKQTANTRLGAVKHLHEPMMRTNANAVLRSAVNFYIQSSSAEQTKLVMGRVWEEKLLEKYDAVFYFPVHDELLFSVAKKDLTEFCKELRPLMETQYADMVVPCRSDLTVGYNFGQLDEISWDKTDEWLFDQQMSNKKSGDSNEW